MGQKNFEDIVTMNFPKLMKDPKHRSKLANLRRIKHINTDRQAYHHQTADQIKGIES